MSFSAAVHSLSAALETQHAWYPRALNRTREQYHPHQARKAYLGSAWQSKLCLRKFDPVSSVSRSLDKKAPNRAQWRQIFHYPSSSSSSEDDSSSLLSLAAADPVKRATRARSSASFSAFFFAACAACTSQHSRVLADWPLAGHVSDSLVVTRTCCARGCASSRGLVAGWLATVLLCIRTRRRLYPLGCRSLSGAARGASTPPDGAAGQVPRRLRKTPSGHTGQACASARQTIDCRD